MRSRAWGAALAATLALSGCSVFGNPVVNELGSRSSGASGARPYSSLVELLPNRTYRMGTGPEWTYSSTVVVGRFTEVQPGRATSAQDDPAGIVVPFDSSEAASRTFHARFAVDHLVAGQPLGEDERVGLAFGPDISVEEVERGLRDLGTVLLFLRDSPVFAYAPNVLGTAEDGRLIAQVATDGSLKLPLLDEEASAGLVRETTVSDLEAAARAPGEDVALDASGAVVLSRRPAE